MTPIRWPGEEATVAEVGGKAYALAALVRAGVDVPPWFVISADAEAMGATAIGADVARAARELAANGELLAVRSSAVEEDGTGHSFAGQLDSYPATSWASQPRLSSSPLTRTITSPLFTMIS
jgi:pyruvate,water dikinase